MKNIGKLWSKNLILAQVKFVSARCPRIVLVLFLTWFPAFPAYTGDIHGTAFKEESKDPVLGVVVELYCDGKQVEKTNTGSDGTYAFQLNTAGKYQIDFSKIPDQCYLSEVTDSLTANDTREWNVRVYPIKKKISSKQLADILGEFASNNNDPGQAFNAFPALSKAGYDNDTLKEIVGNLTSKYPFFFGTFSGTVKEYKNGALVLANAEPDKLRTEGSTIFIEKPGTVISGERAKDFLAGKEATILRDNRGKDSEAKIVLFGKE
jgi:SdrD B-like domain